MKSDEPNLMVSADESYSPPERGATVAHLVEHLRNEILTRRLPAGARLVESDLTQRFSVSRGPVREALRRLAAEGMIEHVPHRGALVRHISRKEVRELFQVRTELETLAARLAAESRDEAARRRFVETIRPIYLDRPRDDIAYINENTLFHEAVLELSGNRQLMGLSLRMYLPLIMARIGDVLDAETLATSVREHRNIAAAILDRDPGTASAAMRAHLARANALALSVSED